jgi:hypothetical protein
MRSTTRRAHRSTGASAALDASSTSRRGTGIARTTASAPGASCAMVPPSARTEIFAPRASCAVVPPSARTEIFAPRASCAMAAPSARTEKGAPSASSRLPVSTRTLRGCLIGEGQLNKDISPLRLQAVRWWLHLLARKCSLPMQALLSVIVRAPSPELGDLR